MTVQEWLGKENQIGIDIWENKYCYENETFDEWLDRVSGGSKDLRQLIIDKKFLPGGRILSNRGLDKLGNKITLSNCYVVSQPEDNIESIFEAATKLARTYSYGGGCGIDISKLSPRGSKVNNTAKVTSGAVSFMELYSLVTGLIGQNGRRGALMISIDCDHPDLEEFIGIKSDLEKVTKANISIKITSDFMQAVNNKEKFMLTFTRKETKEVITKEVDAYEIFNKICRMNWDFAEPGMLFWDRIENWNLLSGYEDFKYAGVNPCAEEPLPAGGSCLLGSTNLAVFVKMDAQGKLYFDFIGFNDTVRKSVIALNELLDEGLPLHPLEEQRKSVSEWRQIGLGIFGLADMLIKLGIRYGSKESMLLCDQIAKAMVNSALEQSSLLAKEFGTFPKYNIDNTFKSNYFYTCTNPETKALVSRYGLRNSQLLTVAPTGSLSTMLGVSGGIEPIYATHYERKTESLHGKDVYYNVYTPIVKEYLDKNNLDDVADLPEYFITAQTLDYKERIHMQAVWQQYIDASISSTVNVPNDFTVEKVEDLYTYAWENGLKGVTIYRDGCARAGILTTQDRKDITEAVENADTEEEIEELLRGYILKVEDDDVIGKRAKLTTGCGTLYCLAFFDLITGDLRETFFPISEGGCQYNIQAISRLVSLNARGGVALEDITKQLKKCGGCKSYTDRAKRIGDTSPGTSCASAVGNSLNKMHKEMLEMLNLVEINKDKVDEIRKKIKPNIVENDWMDYEDTANSCGINCSDCSVETCKSNKNESIKNLCPECKGEVYFSGGCVTCPHCGYSKCD